MSLEFDVELEEVDDDDDDNNNNIENDIINDYNCDDRNNEINDDARKGVRVYDQIVCEHEGMHFKSSYPLGNLFCIILIGGQ